MGYIKQGFKSKQTLTAAQLNHIEDGILDIECKGIQQTPLFANNIEECIDTTKLYVLPDGYIYAYMLTYGTKEITIETKEGGYWQHINNIMEWRNNADYNAMRTNMIPVKEGDTFLYEGHNDMYVNAVYWFDSSKTIISSEYGETTYTAPSEAKYAQFYSYDHPKYLSLSVTYISGSEKKYMWASTGHAFVPADYGDRIVALEEDVASLEQKTDDFGNGVADTLYGKKIIYDGDSICYGAGYSGGYAKIIADLTSGTYVNQAVGGGRLVTKGGNSWHSVVDNLVNLPTDGDLYCFQGGINDYWTKGVLGTYDYTNFDGELDTTTVCGALETIFRYALNTFVGKPICFIITHKIQGTAYAKNSNGDTFKDYHDAMVGICEKYSIPYYDAFSESGLNGWNEAQNNAFLTGNSGGTPDGCHPNEEGYKRYYVPQLIALFEKIMPIRSDT